MRIEPYLHDMQMREPRTSRVKLIAWIVGGLFAIGTIVVPSVLYGHFGIGLSPVPSSIANTNSEPGDGIVTITKKASQLQPEDTFISPQVNSKLYSTHQIIKIQAQGDQILLTTKTLNGFLVVEKQFLMSKDSQVSVNLMNIKWVGYIQQFVTSKQGIQLSTSLIVFANLATLLFFLFRKKIQSGISRAEQTFRDLYSDVHFSYKKELSRSNTYRDLYENANKELQQMKGK